MPSLDGLRERLRLSLWFVPTLFAGFSAVLAFLLITVDHNIATDPSFTAGGTADGARSVLSAIAQSMLSFTGLVFTVTMLVLQLASSQLSPRVMRTFLRDRGNQVVLGLFVATFVFTLLVLREVRNDTDSITGFVPAVSVWAAFALLLASIAAFIWYIDHMAHAIRANTVIEAIWRETVDGVKRVYPDDVESAGEHRPAPHLGEPDVVIHAPRAGTVVGVDADKLAGLATDGDRVLALLYAVGEYVPDGAPLATGWGTWDDEGKDAVAPAISLASERTMEQDVGFGLRQLVDVAIRALSPGTNDPTTAVQGLDRIHDILRRLVTRAYPPPVTVVDGQPRLIQPLPTFEDHLLLALEEITLAGESQVHIRRRLLALLADLASVAPPDRRAAIERRRLAVIRQDVVGSE